ncbi:hypothetical protein FA95DRAFT_1607571 [Auriscalpium vulgare]|uniref:Uncharacterized protein n=1 Tax=Auriscalpium vulgare TaxID=40419 RepID=A0ACB8RPS1_9AGAM|nr:hypothetical protein FA95DRAFT_1607571 [Auriscalpium vulgare]
MSVEPTKDLLDNASDGKMYWADVASSRLQQLPNVPPRIHEDDPSDLRDAEERVAILQKTMDTIVCEKDALHRAMRDIEKHIDPYQDTIHIVLRNANAQRNSFIPAVRLSPEILQIIFKCVATLLPLDIGDLGWIPAVTHVCRVWRRVALGCSPLWSTLVIPLHYDLMSAMITRSKPAPLDVIAEIYSDSRTGDGEGLTIIRRNLHRTRSLHIIARYQSDELKLSGACPILTRLDLELPRDVRKTPSILALNYTPVLQELRVTMPEKFTNFPWDAPCLAQLTSLEIEGQRYNNPVGSPGRLEEVLNALRKMTSLEKLTLAIGARGTTDDGTLDTVQLPRVTCINLDLDIGAAPRFLEHVEILPSTSVYIKFSQRLQDSATSSTKIFAALQSFFHSTNGSDAAITKLIFTCIVPDASNFNMKVLAWRGAPRSYSPQVTLMFTNRASHTWTDGALRLGMLRVFSSVHLREIALTDMHYDENTWKAVLALTPSLQSIETAGAASAVGLCTVLGGPSNSTIVTHASASCVPALSVLKLRKVDFDKDVSLPDGEFGKRGLRLGDILFQWLLPRALVGRSLRELSLEDCSNVSLEDLTCLPTKFTDINIS